MTTLAPVLSTRYFPRAPGWLRSLFLVVAGSLFVAALAQLRIPLPFTPVPITGQTFAVLLVGAILGSTRGAAAILLYIAEGALGLPFFAGGAAGVATLAGPTAGYLLGFVGAAYITGRLAERGMERTLRTSALPFLAGTIIIYLCGAGWLAILFGSVTKAVMLGVAPFLIGDVVKIAAAAVILPAAWRIARN